MRFVEVALGVSVADGENVSLRYDGGDLVLEFVDWREEPARTVFEGVLAFRWQELDETTLRDDMTYEVVGSEWLARQATLQGVPAGDYAHYMLCFNACGVLDVLCRRRAADSGVA